MVQEVGCPQGRGRVFILGYRDEAALNALKELVPRMPNTETIRAQNEKEPTLQFSNTQIERIQAGSTHSAEPFS